MSERENTLDEIVSRLNIAEKISELKDIAIEAIQHETQRLARNEQTVS